MKKQFAIIVSFAMLLCGCTANSSSSKDKTSAAQAVEFSITDHTLQEIIILGNESPTTVDAAEERISELNENLQIKSGVSIQASAETVSNVKYLDASGSEQTCTSATVVESSTVRGCCAVLLYIADLISLHITAAFRAFDCRVQ